MGREAYGVRFTFVTLRDGRRWKDACFGTVLCLIRGDLIGFGQWTGVVLGTLRSVSIIEGIAATATVIVGSASSLTLDFLVCNGAVELNEFRCSVASFAASILNKSAHQLNIQKTLGQPYVGYLNTIFFDWVNFTSLLDHVITVGN